MVRTAPSYLRPNPLVMSKRRSWVSTSPMLTLGAGLRAQRPLLLWLCLTKSGDNGKEASETDGDRKKAGVADYRSYPVPS
jgi:hypothetical protein